MSPSIFHMDANKDRFPLLRKILKAIGLPAEAVDDIVERILDWLSIKDTPARRPGFGVYQNKSGRPVFLSPPATTGRIAHSPTGWIVSTLIFWCATSNLSAPL